MTEGEVQIINELKEMNKLLKIMVEEQKKLTSMFSKYDESYNAMIAGDGFIAR